MESIDSTWSEQEQVIAKHAFDVAYEREVFALVRLVSEKANTLVEIEDVWQLHDFLSARRHEIDGKYDYRYSILPFVFAQLVQQGWLRLEELEGLAPEKLAKIVALTRMSY